MTRKKIYNILIGLSVGILVPFLLTLPYQFIKPNYVKYYQCGALFILTSGFLLFLLFQAKKQKANYLYPLLFILQGFVIYLTVKFLFL